jgi:hypothetical protein
VRVGISPFYIIGKDLSMNSLSLRRRFDSTLFRSLYFEALNDGVGFRANLSDDYRTLVDRKVEMLDDVDEFRDHYWSTESFSKMPFDIGVDREAAAYQKFWEAEEHCRLFNSKLVGWDTRPSVDYQLMARARRIVSRILGDFSFDEMSNECSFGPGATTSMPRRLASQQQKWEFGAHITARALPYYLAFRRLNASWRGGDRQLLIVAGNKVTTVPKSAKVDRVIAIEPDWNMFFQRAVGSMIRRRLQRIGLLTPSAQHNNRNAARDASQTGSHSTIDLSSASDSMCLALGEALLPEKWFRVICDLRSEQGKIQGKTVTYEKISSMGNGDTFELETLLFYALARACCKDGKVLVYGDDIIVPTEYHESVVVALVNSGFSVNEKKTFASGPFRESCGGHFHTGIEVTPPYFKEEITDVAGVIRTANRIRHSASQRGGWYLDARFSDTWNWLAKQVPKSLRGPKELGDSCLHTPFDMATPTWDRDLQQWRVKVLLPAKPVHVAANCWGGVYSSLWGKVSEGSHVSLKSETMCRYGNTCAGGRWDAPDLWIYV